MALERLQILAHSTCFYLLSQLDYIVMKVKSPGQVVGGSPPCTSPTSTLPAGFSRPCLLFTQALVAELCLLNNWNERANISTQRLNVLAKLL